MYTIFTTKMIFVVYKKERLNHLITRLSTDNNYSKIKTFRYKLIANRK